ncbi:TonB-dependent receptor [Cystobacter fuscus DSM 2262]|uniref:TonB-dependent receptor n=1 Tax=Cystobacter fuscus (strain ATCC 25194 / DSM 2262 / NBRC 100088 / M29) TaxID=1242864 RepID=S9QF28_CYSF2|nr:TonB-dependent receptor [Cystobacter fuscus]EPX54958.1 TonB-dependent receptor [Cystobacter fuscus DSM 2262]
MPRSFPLASRRRGMLLAAVLCSTCALAHEVPEEDEAPPEWTQSLTLEELLRVELSTPSKRLQLAREAPGVASVVTREQMRRFGWATIDEILFSQPGFFPSHDYERTTVGTRGLWEGWNNNHLLLLLDGVPMNDSDLATAFTWEISPLFLVKSVEILRGPASALYGSSAINGVIALNTLSSSHTLEDDERLEINNEARVRVGNLGTAAVDAVAVTRSRHLSAVVGFQHQHTDGFSYLSHDGSRRTDASGALQRFLVNDRRDSSYLFVKLEPSRVLRGLSLQYHLQDWNHGTGHGWRQWVPDIDGPMRDRRHIAVASYRSRPGGPLAQEYVFKYQRREYESHVRFYPSGAEDGRYRFGVTEVLETAQDELFGRAQLSGSPGEGLSLLGGVEYSATLYGGDSVHYATADLSVDSEDPPSPPTPVRLGPLYESILGEPLSNVGAYTQFAWNRLLSLPLSLTMGLRYDLKFFHYRDLEQPGTPRRFKSYEQVSPRISLVFTPSPVFSLKFQGGRAFRAPSPGELFGSNTWILEANVERMRPEQVTTFELNADWSISPQLSWRSTLFHSRYENLIGFSASNVQDNLMSQTNVGVESELLVEVGLGGMGRLSAFGNYTYVHLLEGAGRAGDLAWAPAHLAKAGASYQREHFSLALQGRYQGSVLRREEDRVDPLFRSLRPEQVPAWFRLDANVRYQLTSWAAAELKVSNLLDTESYLVKTHDYPFDYRMEGRRVFVSLEANL